MLGTNEERKRKKEGTERRRRKEGRKGKNGRMEGCF